MRTLQHVLDEDAALSDLLLNDELFVIGSDEKNHDDELKDGGCGIEWRMRRGEVVVGGERGSGSARYLKGQMRGLRNTRIRTCLRFGQPWTKAEFGCMTWTQSCLCPH